MKSELASLHPRTPSYALMWDLEWCAKLTWAWLVWRKMRMGNPMQVDARKCREPCFGFCVVFKNIPSAQGRSYSQPRVAYMHFSLQQHCQKQQLQWLLQHQSQHATWKKSVISVNTFSLSFIVLLMVNTIDFSMTAQFKALSLPNRNTFSSQAEQNI